MQFVGIPGQTLERFIAGEVMTVETSYKAAFGFEDASQSDYDIVGYQPQPNTVLDPKLEK